MNVTRLKTAVLALSLSSKLCIRPMVNRKKIGYTIVMRYPLVFVFLTLCFLELSSAKTFILGDSLTCGSFGKELFDQFKVNGEQVVLFCAVSSRPDHWINSVNPSGLPCMTLSSGQSKKIPCGKDGEMPAFDVLAKEAIGANVVVALGTNSLGVKSMDENYFNLANQLSARSKSCFWVGPPHLEPNHVSLNPDRRKRISNMESNLDLFYSNIENAVGKKCKLIDSRPATKLGSPGRPTTDGIHKVEAAGKKWAQEIFPQILRD